jgi:4-hydroxyproline epimerase
VPGSITSNSSDHRKILPRRAESFVLCPGGAYDRSPCGTGCSAKLACLAEDGLLAPGKDWIQESVIGSTYRISYQPGAPA